MNTIAWSQNLTAEKAETGGAHLVSKEDLLSQGRHCDNPSCIERPLAWPGWRPGARPDEKTSYLINTSRGPIVDEKSLAAALQAKSIAGAGLDVFDVEPLPLDHPFRKLANVVITPHLGYVSEQNYRKYFPTLSRTFAPGLTANRCVSLRPNKTALLSEAQQPGRIVVGDIRAKLLVERH